MDQRRELRAGINDPGPSQLNTGTADEQRWTERGVAWKEFYTTDLLTTLDANPRLLQEAIEELRADLRGAYAGDSARVLGVELAERARTRIADG